MRKTLEDKKRELIEGLVARRREVLDAVRQVPPEQLEEAFLGTWSVKDLLAHLVGWDFTNLHAVRQILNGQVPDFFGEYDKDWHSYNARLVETYRVEPFSALQAAIEESHRELVAFLESLALNDIVKGKAPRETGGSVTVRNLLRVEARDERQHAEQVKAAFKIPDSENPPLT